jgi:hypothetical protein
MLPNMVVEELKIRHCLLQLRTAGNFNLPNCAFKSAEKSFDSAVLPGLVRRAALMFDSHFMHRQSEMNRHKSAVIIGSERFWFAEIVDQVAQCLNNSRRASIGKFKRQQFSAAVIDNAKHLTCLSFDTDIRPIQRPNLVGFAKFGRFSKLFAELQNRVVIIFAKLCNEAFAD